MFRMSEQEKREQIGEAVEVYSRLKGELNHINEKLAHAQQDYAVASQVFGNLHVDNGKLIVPPQAYQAQSARSLEGLLNYTQLVELLTERDRLNAELGGAAARLKALAPHLLN